MDNKEEKYSEVLITVSKTKDYDAVRMVLEANKIEYIFKSQLKPEACTGNNFFPLSKIILFVQPESIDQAKVVCKEIISKIDGKGKRCSAQNQSLIRKLFRVFFE